MSVRWVALWSAALVLAIVSPGSIFAQSADSVGVGPTCWNPGPLPDCRLSILSEVGGYMRLGDSSHSAAAATVDWGLLFNRGPQHAFGVAVSIWVPDDAIVGPSLRYRRWFGSGNSLELAFGTSVWGNGPDAGSIFGLVRFNVTSWLALGVRAQHLRFDCGNLPDCGGDQGRIFAGVEVGEGLGRWLSLAAPVLGLLWLAGED